MKKIIVIGCPGSGKSRFSRALHHQTDIFHERLADVLAKDAWIIDGNYASTLELRLDACDTAFFLDYPPDVCLDGVRERRGKPRSDLPWIETEEDAAFIEFIKGYHTNQRPQVLALLEKYCAKNVIVFKSREQADAFLSREKR